MQKNQLRRKTIVLPSQIKEISRNKSRRFKPGHFSMVASKKHQRASETARPKHRVLNYSALSHLTIVKITL